VRVRPNLDHRAAPSRAGDGRSAAAAAARERVGGIIVAFLVVVVVVVGGVAVETGGPGGGVGAGVDESEDGVVLAQSLDGVSDEGDVAAPGAREGCVGAGGEHFGETLLAEAMAALEQKRHSLLVVVPRLANRTTRHFHFCRNPNRRGRARRRRWRSSENFGDGGLIGIN
ncbi:hypothetical protein PanWU01x14_203250, partial [Parasponia andersonii]